jgi:DNA-3-methyladenine glycosylase
MKPSKLKSSFYNRPTLDVAVDLLGKLLIYQSGRTRLGGRLVEVESYIGEDDPACHASVGKTPRNAIMYGPAGYLYVYFTYGNHFMLNIVTEKESFPAAILLRGLEPLFGVKQMMANRGVEKPTEIASGPGKLAKALGITTEQKGLDVAGSQFYLLDDKTPAGKVWCSPRIGLTDGKDKPWRFFIKDNPHVSKGAAYVNQGARPLGD